MSYEGLALHLLITARELKELRIDPYYFVVSGSGFTHPLNKLHPFPHQAPLASSIVSSRADG